MFPRYPTFAPTLNRAPILFTLVKGKVEATSAVPTPRVAQSIIASVNSPTKSDQYKQKKLENLFLYYYNSFLFKAKL